MKTIRVGLADAQPIILCGLESILGQTEDIKVEFAVNSIADLMKAIRAQPVDVLICDYMFDEDQDADGLRLIERLLAACARTAILVHSAHCAFYLVARALRCGAAGFVGKKNTESAELITAIRSVHGGHVYLPAKVASAILSEFCGADARHGRASLSPRELEVVRMVAAGRTITEIAHRLSRSPKTISNQKNSAMKKMDVRTDADLVRAVRHMGVA